VAAVFHGSILSRRSLWDVRVLVLFNPCRSLPPGESRTASPSYKIEDLKRFRCSAPLRPLSFFEIHASFPGVDLSFHKGGRLRRFFFFLSFPSSGTPDDYLLGCRRRGCFRSDLGPLFSFPLPSPFPRSPRSALPWRPLVFLALDSVCGCFLFFEAEGEIRAGGHLGKRSSPFPLDWAFADRRTPAELDGSSSLRAESGKSLPQGRATKDSRFFSLGTKISLLRAPVLTPLFLARSHVRFFHGKARKFPVGKTLRVCSLSPCVFLVGRRQLNFLEQVWGLSTGFSSFVRLFSNQRSVFLSRQGQPTSASPIVPEWPSLFFEGDLDRPGDGAESGSVSPSIIKSSPLFGPLQIVLLPVPLFRRWSR